MKTAGIRELKAHLSAYIRDVERGETVLVTDRGRVVAQMSPPGGAERADDPGERTYREWVARGLVRPAAVAQGVVWTRARSLGAPKGTARRVLDADRGE
jgi:antitoxin (DNA-binding transcriptional repressor) of toxin-antitoxin stability system